MPADAKALNSKLHKNCGMAAVAASPAATTGHHSFVKAKQRNVHSASLARCPTYARAPVGCASAGCGAAAAMIRLGLLMGVMHAAPKQCRWRAIPAPCPSPRA